MILVLRLRIRTADSGRSSRDVTLPHRSLERPMSLSHSQPASAPHPDHPTPAWSDARLLACVARHTEDPGLANAAFDIFVQRWRDCLYGHVHFMCCYPPAQQIGDTHIESETWYTVFRRAGTYDPRDTTGDAQSARTAGWLKRIADRALRMSIRRRGDRYLCSLSDEMLRCRPALLPDLATHNPRCAIVAACLQGMSERDADVLRTSASFIIADGTVVGMPAEIRDKLLRRYETTEINLRQVRCRAYRRLRTCIERHLRTPD